MWVIEQSYQHYPHSYQHLLNLKQRINLVIMLIKCRNGVTRNIFGLKNAVGVPMQYGKI